MTNAQIAAWINGGSDVDIYAGPNPVSPWTVSQTVATASTTAPSTVWTLTPPDGHFMAIPANFPLLATLFYAGPTAAPEDTILYFGALRADRAQPSWPPNNVPYQSWYLLTAQEQLSTQNQNSTLQAHIGDDIFIPSGDKLIIAVTSSQAIDTSLSGTVLKFTARVGAMR